MARLDSSDKVGCWACVVKGEGGTRCQVGCDANSETQRVVAAKQVGPKTCLHKSDLGLPGW